MSSFVESKEFKSIPVDTGLLALSVEKLEKANSTKNVEKLEKANSTKTVENQKKKSRPRATASKFVRSKKPLARSRKVFKAKNVHKFSTTPSTSDVTASPKMLIAVTQSSSLSLLSKQIFTQKIWCQLHKTTMNSNKLERLKN